jgi:3-mercaptopyruvate sulfurtransferase SseA
MHARRAIASALGFALLAALVLPPRVSTASPGAPAMEDVRAEAARGGYRLIDLEGTRGLLEREAGRVLLVDTRQDWEYRTGHIPGAVNFPFEPTAWSRLKNRWALARALGADKSQPLVFY